MNCAKRILCYYANRKSAVKVSDAAFQIAVGKYCNGDSRACAVYQVMNALGFLKVPLDLTPYDSARAAELVKRKPA